MYAILSVIVLTENEIKEVTLRYCVETLRNNDPDDDVKDKIEEQKKK